MEVVLKILIVFCMFFISALLSVLVYKIYKKNQEDKILRAKREIIEIENENIKKLSEKFFKNRKKKYNELQIYLSRCGANHMLQRVVDPLEFIIANVVFAVILAVLGHVIFGILGAVIGFFIGYNILKVLLDMSNDMDNDEILNDVRSLYETLIIKTEGGIFLTESIKQCYKVVSNKRLKKALLQLSSELAVTNNIKDSLDRFNLKFSNRYINTFCITVKQCLESGMTLNSLNDITNQFNKIQQAIEIKQNSKLEMEITITQTLVIVAMLVLIMFVLASNLMDFSQF